MIRKILFWTIAVVITLAASVYQRSTGPTYPKKLDFSIDGKHYSQKFPRTGDDTDCRVLIEGLDQKVKAEIYYRRYPSEDSYTKLTMSISDEGLSAFLPVQPPAGKLDYYVSINGQIYFDNDPLVIRFKGKIPVWALVPHIFFMFVSMLLGCYALLLTFIKNDEYKKYIKLTVCTMLVGGFVFGPIVQHYAFGQAWTGFPCGFDLTDNKTLIAFIALLMAYFTRNTKHNRLISILSIIVLFVIISIPHSFKGSELDYNTGEVITSKELSN